MAAKAERTIAGLFNAYCAEPSILPHHIQERMEEFGLERTACDYIAGMTDRFAIEEHQKLFDPAVKP
jgi:dGTPase